MRECIEPLEPRIWFDEVARVCRSCDAENSSVASLLRRAFYLMCLTPAPIRGLVRSTLTEATLERWLDAGATISSAFALFDPPTQLSVSRNAGSDEVEVLVQLYGAGTAGSVRHSDISVALVGAWCRAVLAIRELPEPPAGPVAAEPSDARKDSLSSQH